MNVIYGLSKQSNNLQINNNNNLIISNKICLQPKDLGNICENKRIINQNEIQIKWYFDKETFQCLAFWL
ncbi:BPTI/Kunitz inhibitor domain-containing protein [Meloidogyne graminicola]|uniref:BPTI/Kunitz inhibitor domain-containing protein n=1 Tax=Meloidogyne graminicola TaxID=189291 RepID=A0A8S9ZIR3_9BILA|nr:BPTI/Kunitz inhibitor domain-containing protein [Meloidogyne graminicola]